MGTPTQKRTTSSKKRRAAHFAINVIQASTCSNCKKPVRSHCACGACGFYKGKAVLKLKPVKGAKKVATKKKAKK